MNAIAGYLVVAMDSNGYGVGTWSELAGLTQNLQCSSTLQTGIYKPSTNEYDPNNVHFAIRGGNIAAHTLNFNGGVPPTLFNLNWTAPSPGVGPVTFAGIATVDPFDSWLLPAQLASGPGTAPETFPSSTSAAAPTSAAVTPVVAVAGGGVTTTALSAGQIAGIVIGVVLGVLLIGIFVFPLVWAATHKSDPRVQRFTQRMTGGFRR